MIKGKIDKKSGRQSIYGYALDTDSSASIEVILKIDGTKFLTNSNIYKEGVQAKYGHGNHGFKIMIPSHLKDNKKHTVELLSYTDSKLLDKTELIFKSVDSSKLSSNEIGSNKDTSKVKNYNTKSIDSSSSLAKKDKYSFKKKDGHCFAVKNADGFKNTEATLVKSNSIAYCPKVSVIIPVYNTSEYVEQCITSVINQTLSEIEIIAVDDGSTDDSIEKLLNLARYDNRITVVQQQNNYAGTARNAGLELAKGKYLAFFDSDDFFDPKLLQEAYDLAEAENSDVVCFQFLKYEQETGTIDNEKKFGISLSYKGKSFVSYSPKDTLISDKLFATTTPAPWNKLFRKSLVDKFNIRFQSLKATNDLFFTYSNLFLAQKITYLFKPFAFYRNNPSNLSNSGKRGMDFSKAYFALEKSLSNNNLIDAFSSSLYYSFISSTCWEYDRTVDNKSDIKNLLNDLIYKKCRNYMQVLPSSLSERVRKIIGTKVSIIICSFNDETFIRECLDSVISQTLKDIEIICVNDGSTDNTLKIMKEYEKKDTRIIVIDQPNSGLSEGRNKALKIASGEYVQFLDSDDYLSSNACEKLYNRSKEFNLDMLFFSGYNFNSETRVLTENTYWDFKYLPQNFKSDRFSLKDCSPFVHRMAVSSCLTVYKLDFIKKYKMEFPSGLCFEDNLFFIKAIFKADNLSILNDKLYFRRIHSKSITQNWEKNVSDYLEIVSRVLEFVSSLDNQLFLDNYKKSYLTSCINRFNTFSDDSKEKYYTTLSGLLDKYNISKKTVSYKNNDNNETPAISNTELMKYLTGRIDIRFFSSIPNEDSQQNHINSLTVSDKDALVVQPKWCNTGNKSGFIISSTKCDMEIFFKCSGKGKVSIDLRGFDFTIGDDKKQRLPIFIDFKNFSVNGKELIPNNSKVVDHDHPFNWVELIQNDKDFCIKLKWSCLSKNSRL